MIQRIINNLFQSSVGQKLVLLFLFALNHSVVSQQFIKSLLSYNPVLERLKDCNHNEPLGMINGMIQASQITTSSNYPLEWDKGCSKNYGRLYQTDGLAWCPKFKSSSEWIQIDLGVPAKITGVLTQGRGDGLEWVTHFMISYSLDGLYWQYVEDQYGNQKLFEGNQDSFSVKHFYLDEAIIIRFIKFHTSRWNRHPSMKIEVIGCQSCRSLLGLPPYGKLSSSGDRHNDLGTLCKAEHAHLLSNKAWCAKNSKTDQWIQIDLGPSTLITGVVSMGRGDSNKKQWVTQYKLSFSNDSRLWVFYKEYDSSIKIFQGNVDQKSEMINFLSPPITARFVRLHPMAWNHHPSLRFGLLGCPYKGHCSNEFMQVNNQASCVENLAYHKESFTNNKRHNKRHVMSEWTHGHSSKAVDGDILRSCIVLDNFYVEKPVWMVDLGKKIMVSGVLIVTGDANRYSKGAKSTSSHQDYLQNLERLSVYVHNNRHHNNHKRHADPTKKSRNQSRDSQNMKNKNQNSQSSFQRYPFILNTDYSPALQSQLNLMANQNSDNNRIGLDGEDELNPVEVHVNLEATHPDNLCNQLTRLNKALFRPKLHFPCLRALKGRYVSVEASGVPNRSSKLFGAVLCEVMVYE